MNTRVYQKSFAGGEIAPEMFGRIDDVKYQNGAAKMRNFVVKPQGAAKSRAGFEFRASTQRDAQDPRTTKSRIIPFSFSLNQSVVLEFRGWQLDQNGQGIQTPEYFGTVRIHTDSGQIQHATATSYIPGSAVTLSADGNGRLRVNYASHLFQTGDTVTFRVTNAGTFHAGLVAGQVYYVVIDINNNPINGFLVSTTAPASPSYVMYNATFTGAHWTDKYYAAGSVVTYSVGGTPYPFVAQRDVDASTPAVKSPGNQGPNGYWFRQLSSTLELRHTYTEAELFELTYTQSFDVVTLAHPNHPVRELRRYGTNAWALQESSFNALAVPQNVAVSSIYGNGILVNYVGTEFIPGSTLGSAATAILYGQEFLQPLTEGELVYVRTPGFSYLDNKFFVVGDPSVDAIQYNPDKKRKIGLRSLASQGAVSFYLAAAVGVGPNGPASGSVWTVNSVSVNYAAFSGYNLSSLIVDGRYLLIQGGDIAAFYYRFINVGFYGANTFQVERYNPQTGSWDGFAMTAPVVGPTVVFWPAVGGGTAGKHDAINASNQSVVAIVQPTTSIQDSQNSYRVCAQFNALEGPASATVTATNNLLAVGSKNTLTWSAVPGATAYSVYKEVSGLFGYIGRTTSTSFIDDNISPDFSKTTPYADAVFNGPGYYPGAVAYFDQRKCFAGAYNEPNRLLMSRSFTETDFSYSIPSNDSDRIDVEIAAREANRIRHIVPLGELLLLSNAAEWRISPVNSEALTPSTISARPQSYIGANSVQPIIVNNSAIFCAARGGHVREMGFNFQAQGFVTGDLSLRAPHLFDDYELTDMAYQKAPIPVLWTVSTSGKLLGLTYVPEEQVGAWHQHDTDGVFESVAVIPLGEEDRLWAVIKRTINGTDVRYIERMAPMQLGDIDDGIYSDSAKVVTLSPAGTTVTGLSHLEGKTVCVLADGVVQTKKTVSGGAISLDATATKVIVGLPIQAELQTTPIAMQIDGLAQGRVKAINKAWIKLYRSVGLNVGPSGSLTVPAYPYDATGGEKTEEIDVTLLPAWQRYGQVLLKHSEPVPLSVLGMTYEVAVGG